MDFTIEALAIAVFAVLPGFVSVAIRSVFTPNESVSGAEWIAGSVVTSVVLNALSFLLILLVNGGGFDLSRPLSELSDQISNQSSYTGVYTYLYSIPFLFFGAQ